MYTIFIDDALLYSTGLDDEEHVILSPTLSLDINGAGSLTFTIHPDHPRYSMIRKLKSIVTVFQGDYLLFRGRVLEDERDFYNQKKVYCEGDRSFLLDSLWAEQTVTGNAQDLFRQLIENHNAQVEEDKRFTVGIITAVGTDVTIDGEQQIETRRYWDTATMIEEKLMGVYGGYLRTRTEGDTHYIDWLSEFEEESSQPIAFSVNLLDLKDKVDAGDVFTCLIPLGYSEIGDDGTYTDPVDITSVNGGRNYIQDDDAVALYGKIWRSKTWGSTKDPAQLLAKAREHMKTGAEVRTLTLTAVDMHFEDGDAEMIHIGTKVQIESDPHGIHLHKVCAKMDIDLENPEKTPYTFGEPPRTLSEGVVRAEKSASRLTGSGGGGGGGGGKGVQEELTEILRWAKINVDEANSLITANAGKIDTLTGEMSSVELILNGDEGEAGLVTRVGNAESSIKANSDGIETKVSKDGVISAINQTSESVTIDAGKINLKGYVTASELEAEIATIKITDTSYLTTAGLSTKSLDANHITASSASIGGYSCSWGKIEVVTSVSLSKSYTTVPGGNGMDYVVIGGVSLSKETEEIRFMGRGSSVEDEE